MTVRSRPVRDPLLAHSEARPHDQPHCPIPPMNIRLIAIVPGLIALSNGIAQVTVDWNQPTRGLSIALDQTNNVYTVDYEYALGGDISLTKRTSAGAFLWASGYNQTSTTMFDKATWVATDQLGNAIVSGTLMSGYSNPVNANSIVMKFGPTGTLLWRQVYETPFDGSWTWRTKRTTSTCWAWAQARMGSGPR